MTVSRVVDALDGYQRDHRWLSFPLAVAYKFADDQGPYLTALITYYGFLSLFPLLLLLASVLGFVLQGDPALQDRLINSALAEFPVIGSSLGENVHSLKGSSLGLVIAVLGTVYGCLGVAGATQNAVNRAWAVPRNERPNPIALRVRSVLLIGVLGAGVVLTTAVSALATSGSGLDGTAGTWLGIAAIPLTTVANVGLFMVAFRVLTAREVSTRHLRVGALVAGIGWQLIQGLGTYLVGHTLRGAPEVYGVFGLVLGLIAWIYLLALVIVLAAEINVVAEKRLWPRALLTPFTDRVCLTAADERAYTAYAESERHKGFQTVDVAFAPPDHVTNPKDTPHPGADRG
jgi:YihY family inner membrane protein